MHMDGGGELAKSHALKKLLQRLHYLPEVTGAYSSSQNGRAEHPHQDFGNMIRFLLYGNSIQPKYWELGAYHAGTLLQYPSSWG